MPACRPPEAEATWKLLVGRIRRAAEIEAPVVLLQHLAHLAAQVVVEGHGIA